MWQWTLLGQQSQSRWRKVIRGILYSQYSQRQRVLSKITRFLTCLPDNTELPPDSWEEDSSLLTDLSDTLNIDKTLITSTQLLRPPSFTELAPTSPLTFDDFRTPSPVSLKEVPHTTTEPQEDDTDITWIISTLPNNLSCPLFLAGTNQPVFRPQNHQDLQLLPIPTSRHPSCPLILWRHLPVPCWWLVDCRCSPPTATRLDFCSSCSGSFPNNMT